MPGKYLRVYHFLEAKWALDDLEKQRLKLSLFDVVDDKRELKAYRLDGLDHLNNVLIEHFTRRYCIACFAPNSSDARMWDEYGHRRRGICLGFDVKKTLLRKVEYVPEQKVANFPHEILAHLPRRTTARVIGQNPSASEKRCMDYLDPFVLTKFDEFKYEQELRGFLTRDEEEGGRYFAKFFKNGMYLREVVLGNKCEITAAEVQELLKSYPRQPIIVTRNTDLTGSTD